MGRPAAPTPRPVAIHPMACSRCGLWVDGSLKTPAAMEFLNVSKPRLYELKRQGKLACKFDGRHRMWSKVSLVAFLESLPDEPDKPARLPARARCAVGG